MKKSTIYTKTGDDGVSSLYSGERVSKSHPIFEVLGNLDELNASIGIVTSEECKIDSDIEFLHEIQSRLLDIGSYIATNNNQEKLNRTNLDHLRYFLTKLEKEIDIIDSSLPKLTNFILPSGHAHLARAICRRTERSIVELYLDKSIDGTLLQYINRLSDYLFVLARKLNIKSEIKYKK